MSKHILVCLPISAEQRNRIEAVQGFAYRFTTPDTATVEDALWADAVLGNLPVPLIRQNDHLEWFQSNTAGPNNYLEPGVLPEGRIVTNATGAYGLAISECMLAMWLSLLKELPTYRDNQREHRWHPPATLWAALRAAGCCAWAWAISARTLPGGRMRWVLRWWACAAPCTRTPPARTTAPVWWRRAHWTQNCRRPTLWR